MRRTVVSAGVLLVVGLSLLIWWRGCYLTREPQDLSLNFDEEPMTASQDNRAGRELFPPDKYLVHARAISVQRWEDHVERAQLRIERVYVGEPSLKGRTFEAVQYQIDTGHRNFSVSVRRPHTQNPPMEVGEVGIWWVMRSGYKDYLVADFDEGLAIVGGCEPARKGIASKSRRHHYPLYEDALEYAALWNRLYNASDTPSQMAILRQAVVSRNPIISNGAFKLLFARRPPGFLECLKELAADPNTPAEKLRVIKDFVDDVGKKKVKEKEPEPF